MKLRWEPPRQGIARGFSPAGRELAQVTHTYSASGDDLGWTVLLLHPEGELFDRFETVAEATAAAEAALDGEET